MFRSPLAVAFRFEAIAVSAPPMLAEFVSQRIYCGSMSTSIALACSSH
jgi:hypothetical protein